MEFRHVSVLLNETIDSLNIKPEGVYVDGTLGGGGHSLEIVKRLSGKGRLIGLDRDENAIQAASERLKDYKDRVTFVRSNYDRFPVVMQELGLREVDGIVLDLGVSSYQLDTPERGFSYREYAPLDMRMDQRQEKTAADIVNESSEKELLHILRDYGEEKFATQIARRIVKQREDRPILTTFELNDIVKESIPVKFRLTGGHPSKRTFQAIRIALNAELESLEKVLPEMIEGLRDKGRLSIITFHSLEDRIVKNIFRTAQNPCTCPPNFPVCVCGNKSKGKVITSKPILPSEEEIENNKRSKSAKLRVFERRAEEK